MVSRSLADSGRRSVVLLAVQLIPVLDDSFPQSKQCKLCVRVRAPCVLVWFVPHPDTLFTSLSKQGKPTGTKRASKIDYAE